MGVSENSHHGAECSGNDGEGDVSPELVAEDGDNDETDVEGSDNDGDGDFPPELVADDGDSDVSELEGSDNGLDGDPPPEVVRATTNTTIQPFTNHWHSVPHYAYAPITKKFGSPLCVFLLCQVLHHCPNFIKFPFLRLKCVSRGLCQKEL